MKIFFCITLVWILADNQSSGFLCTFDDRELGPGNLYTARSPIDTNPGYTWKSGKIPYVFMSNNVNVKNLIRYVMKKIEQHSCFKFIEIPNRQNIHHLQIRTPTSALCGGEVALRTHNEMTMEIYDQGCNSGEKEGLVLHELMHVLGVMHTQNRADRNNSIYVNWDNIKDNRNDLHQYKVCKQCRIEPTIPYECDSIMHYGTGTLQKDVPGTGPTMTAKNPSSCKLTFNGPSKATTNDWKLLNILGSKVCHQADCECINPFDGPLDPDIGPGHPKHRHNCGRSYTPRSDCHVECNGGCVDQTDQTDEYEYETGWCRSRIACGIYHSDSIGRK